MLLTGRGEEGSLGRVLFDKWNDAQRPEDKWDQGKIGRNVMMDGVLKLKVQRNSSLSPKADMLNTIPAELQGSITRSGA